MKGKGKKIYYNKSETIQFDKAVSELQILQAREQAYVFYKSWKYRIPNFFERYQLFDEKQRDEVFEDMRASERFVIRDEGTTQEVRTWVKQMCTHLKRLDSYVNEENKLEDKLVKAVQRRQHLQDVISSWEEADEQRLGDIKRRQNLRKKSIFSTLSDLILKFCRGNFEKYTSINEQEEILLKPSKNR